MRPSVPTAEHARLAEDEARTRNWKRWGAYLAERQWGNVREDYSADGNWWRYFPHDHARSRVYRWGEDGLLGICDREARLCFAVALWNGRDPILKERLFGLSNPEGNHGEDVKECYYYLDATPTHSYLKALYKYPQRAFPYEALVAENRRRSRLEPEYELLDTGIFDEDRYFDVTVEYAKNAPDDICIRITVANRGPEAAPLYLLPTLWFRNTWVWGRNGEDYAPRPRIGLEDDRLVATHATLGTFHLAFERDRCQPLFTHNETNRLRLYGVPSATPYVKDAFHRYLVEGEAAAVAPSREGTKAALLYRSTLAPGETFTVPLRLADLPSSLVGVDEVFALRIAEADGFYAERTKPGLTTQAAAVVRQAYAGLLWCQQFYAYDVRSWLEGDPAQPSPPPGRTLNAQWKHLYNRDILSMPDTWEYPWYAAWDLAFQMIPMARIDPDFAKHQLTLLLREWYMHPNGQLPAYELALGDANPPVHAWAAWRVYKISAARGQRDRLFLERVFHKLLLNFTWWVNRKDEEGNNLFSGGFLGLDNIGVLDRSRPLPFGGHLEQADGTAWMAFYCVTMLQIALELSKQDPAYDDVASKFFEHFIGIVDAINALGGSGLWCEQDGFYYDQIHTGAEMTPLRVRSLVGLVPLLAVEVLEREVLDALPRFTKRMRWLLDRRADLARYVSLAEDCGCSRDRLLLAIPSRERLLRVLGRMLDEREFLSPYGIRSLSRAHEEVPFRFSCGSTELVVRYEPGESTTGLFGGNSNWRGPVWLPLNYLLIEALERYQLFYGDELRIECPTGSGHRMTLGEVARELSRRLGSLFLPDTQGRRPCHGDEPRYATHPGWKDLVLFYEYFHGDTGRGAGASHQTGWTALVLRLLEG